MARLIVNAHEVQPGDTLVPPTPASCCGLLKVERVDTTDRKAHGNVVAEGHDAAHRRTLLLLQACELVEVLRADPVAAA